MRFGFDKLRHIDLRIFSDENFCENNNVDMCEIKAKRSQLNNNVINIINFKLTGIICVVLTV